MKVEISTQEINALDELMKDAKVPIPMGMVLGVFRTRIQQEFNKEQEKQMKEKLNGKGKGKTE